MTTRLTEQQTLCLRYAADGHLDREIAVLTGLALGTVQTHIARARQRLGARNRAHVIALAYPQLHPCPTCTGNPPCVRCRRPFNTHRSPTSRGLCRRCYVTAWRSDTLDDYPPKRTIRFRGEFVADYRLLRSEGYTRQQIADRLGMSYDAVTAAYLRAVRAGDLTPDRRAA